MNAVFFRLEIQWRVGFVEGAEDRDFDGQVGQFESGDGLGEESGIADDGFGGGGKGLDQGFAGVEQADAAAEGVGVAAMEGNETSAGAGEEGVG